MNEAGMSAVNKPYEVFEHTADVGLDAYGGSLEELFVNAAKGRIWLTSDDARLLFEG